MNNTKDQFNSAKNTLKSNLNKSNSIRNLLTENSLFCNNSNSNLNTMNSNLSKDKKESPGNPYLMEKIKTMLNKNKIINNNLINSFSNSINYNGNFTNQNIYNLDKSFPNSNRDCIRNEINNLNIQNVNYTNLTPKNNNNSNNTNKSNKIVSENLNKNLIYIMQEKLKYSNKKNCFKNKDFFKKLEDIDNSKKNTYEDKNILDRLKDFNFNNNPKINNEYLSTKKKLNINSFLSPLSSKKRLEEKFYNYTENKNESINNVFDKLLDDNDRNNNFFTKPTFTNCMENKQIQFISKNNDFSTLNVKNNNFLKQSKFDFSRYNFKSQDLTYIMSKTDLDKNIQFRQGILSNDSRYKDSNSYSKEKSNISKIKNQFKNLYSKNENLFFGKKNEMEKKNFIKIIDNKKTRSLIDSKKNNFSDSVPFKKSIDNIIKNEEYNSNKIEKEVYIKQDPKNINDSLFDIDKEEILISENWPDNKIITKEIKNLNKKSDKKKNIILQDIKSLHLITHKALTTKNNINFKGDSIEEDRKTINHYNSSSTKKALYIDDNSEMPVGVAKSQEPIIDSKNKFDNNKFNNILNMNIDNIFCKTESKYKSPSSNSFSNCNSVNNYNISERDRKQIINIININNNYNIANFNLTSNDLMYYVTNPNSNIKDYNNSKKKYDAFIMTNQSNKSKIICNSNTYTQKTKNKINPNKINKDKNISTFSANLELNNCNNESKTNKTKICEKLNSNKITKNLNYKYQNTKNHKNFNPLDVDNIINLKYSTSLNTPLTKINEKENKQNFSNNKKENIYLNGIDYLDTSKEKNISYTSKNNSSNFFCKNIDYIKKGNNNENKIKEILKSYKKDEDSDKKNFLKISVGNLNNK